MSQQICSMAGVPVFIETNNFLLRSMVPNDVSVSFLRWMNSRDMMEGLNLASINFTKEQIIEYIRGFDNLNNYFIGIFDKKNNNTLIGFYTIDINLTHKLGNITAGVGEEGYVGKSVLWATIDALLDHFYTYRDIYKMVARITTKNRRMLFCFVKNPRFTLEATLKEECRTPDGERVDILIFSSFRHEKINDE